LKVKEITFNSFDEKPRSYFYRRNIQHNVTGNPVALDCWRKA